MTERGFPGKDDVHDRLGLHSLSSSKDIAGVLVQSHNWWSIQVE